MKTEFEITFYPVNVEQVQQKIQGLGGVCTKPKTLMKRVMFRHPSDKNSYLRVRNEGDKTTCTFKTVSNGRKDIHSVQELETVVEDFDTMKDIFLKMGIEQKAYQENYREVWSIDNEIELMIDIWPGLEPYIEIEGESEELVRKYTRLLGFDYEQGIFGTVSDLYIKYKGIPEDVINNTKIITFGDYPKAESLKL